jgi:hypothetical protein
MSCHAHVCAPVQAVTEATSFALNQARAKTTVPISTLTCTPTRKQIIKRRRIPPTRKTFFLENRPVTFDLEVHPVEAFVTGESEPKLLALVVGMPVLMQDSGQIEAGRSHEMLQQSRIMTMLFTMKGERKTCACSCLP